MEMLEKKNNKISFQMDMDESVANAIRRYVNHIPVLAIDEVEIIKNDSPLYDETIAHRVGLIPIKTEKAASEKTAASVKLHASKEGLVYSGEFKGGEKVVYDRIPITLINKGQEVEIVGKIRAGKGVEHAKFSPGLMFYRNTADAKIEKDCPQEIIESCKKNIVKSEGNKIIIKDIYSSDLCEAVIEKHQKEGKVQIEIIPGKDLVVTVETFGQMDAKEIFKKSIEAIKKDLTAIEKKIEK